MPCSSIYCINNTGLVGADDTYITGGTHNGYTYWSGQTNGWVIFYSTGTTIQWCLSDTFSGTCSLAGKTPCYSECPDLNNAYFNSGVCSTPTPTPTQNCSVLDFNAIFDCEFIPTPTPTPTASITPTPTITPTATNPCSIIGIDAIAYRLPETLPLMVDNNTSLQVFEPLTIMNCGVSGDVTFNLINDDIVCSNIKIFQDCYNSELYYCSNVTQLPGESLGLFQVYGALVNNESKCISYIGDSDNNVDININQIIINTTSFGNVNDGKCILCITYVPPSPTPTPTSTVTPTVTPTMTLTPTMTPTPDASPTPTPTMTMTMTPTMTQTPTMTPSSTPSCSNDTLERSSAGGFYQPMFMCKDNSGNYFTSDNTPFIKYFINYSNSQPLVGTNAFKLSYNNTTPSVTADSNIVYNSTNNKLYVFAGSYAGVFVLDLNTWAPGVVSTSTTRINVDYIYNGFSQPTTIEGMVYNSINNRVYFITTMTNRNIGYIDCSTNTVTYLDTTLWGIYPGNISSMVYNPLVNKIYLKGNTMGQSLKIIDCQSNTVSTISIGGTTIHSMSLKPNTNTLYILITPNIVIEFNCATNTYITWPSTSSPKPFGFEGNSTYNIFNDKIYVSISTTSYGGVLIVDTITKNITSVTNWPSNQIGWGIISTNNSSNKIFVFSTGSEGYELKQICGSPHS